MLVRHVNNEGNKVGKGRARVGRDDGSKAALVAPPDVCGGFIRGRGKREGAARGEIGIY